MLPDPKITLVYSLHSWQQCSSEWDDGSVPAKTADRQKENERGKSNLHAEEDFRDGGLQWSNFSSGHTGANRSVDFFRECFYSGLTLTADGMAVDGYYVVAGIARNE